MISHFCILTKLPILPKYTQIPHLCTVSPHHMYRAGFTGSSQTHIFFCCHTPSIAEVQAGLGVLFIMSRRRCWRRWHCNAPPCSMSRRSKRRWRWVQEASCTSLENLDISFWAYKWDLGHRGEYFSEKPIFLHGPQKWPCTRIQEPLAPGQ